MPDTGSMCYDSCKSLGKCERCSWTTCYDDLLFMKSLVQTLKSELCIDDERVFLSGCSNGGIFTYYLSQQMPEVFRGFIIESAQPLKGYMSSPKALKGSHLLTLHGREDTTIPINGGVDGYNEWIYNSVEEFTKSWAEVQGCDMSSYKQFSTPYDSNIKHRWTKGYDLKCYEYTKGCAARVVNCEYYGTHANYASYDAKLSYWLFANDLETSVAPSSEAALDSEPEQSADDFQPVQN